MTSESYDKLDRILTSAVTYNGQALPSKSFTYDAIGNLTGKSDVGTYTYGPSKQNSAISLR